MNSFSNKLITTIALVLFDAILIIGWYIVLFLLTLYVLVQLLKWREGDLSVNEGYLMVGLLSLNISFILGFLGVIPAYFSYNFLLKKLTARFGLQIDRPKRLFAFSAFLIYGLPLLFFLWAIFLS